MLTVHFILGLLTMFFTVVVIPPLYKDIDNFYTSIWYKLDQLTTNGKKRIQEYSIQTIKNIYEKNNKISIKKIIVISVLLNFSYGIVLFVNNLHQYSTVIHFTIGVIIFFIF